MQRRFSQRYGYLPVKEAIQIESMDSDLRNSLWNALDIYFWSPLYTPSAIGLSDFQNTKIRSIFKSIYADYFKHPLDSLSYDWGRTHGDLRKYFFECAWHEVYDFLEFMTKLDTDQSTGYFEYLVNQYLKREVSGYRLVEKQITPIVDPIEISEIETTISDQPDSVSEHITTALRFLSDRHNPDYRNSVKESISSVEAQCMAVLGKDSGTLGDLIKKLDQRAPTHPALERAFSTLYGYSSDENGIRHALIEGGRTVTFEEAQFMLVACSAFVNYVRATSSS